MALSLLVPLYGAAAGNAIQNYIPLDKQLDPAWVQALFMRGERKIYRGPELETIGMPCGGIAAGQVYVRGDGTLAQWWIDNTYWDTGYGDPGTTTGPIGRLSGWLPDQTPASAQSGGSRVCRRGAVRRWTTAFRRLSREDFDDIGFIGEYPIATIRYGSTEQPPLPVEIQGEVFSPWIPINTRDSANPATILRYTLHNISTQTVEVTIGGWLQNPVWLGRPAPEAQRRNRVVDTKD